MSLREQKKKELQEKIQVAARELFLEKEFDQRNVQLLKDKWSGKLSNEVPFYYEKESNVRKYLNLGHTFGHSVEYQFKIPHGHAVMIGIIYQFI